MEQNSPLDALRLFEDAWNEARSAFLASHDDFADKLASTRQTLRSCAGNIEKHKANFDQLSDATSSRLQEVRALVEANAGNAEAEAKLAAAEAKLAEMEGALAEKDRALESALADAKVAQADKAAAEDRAAALAAELESLKSADASSADRLKAAEDTEKALMAELEALRTSQAEAKEAIAAAQDDAKQAIAAAQDEAKQARTRLDEAEGALTELEKSAGPLKATLDAAQAELETTKAELLALQTQAQAADTAKASVQGELEELREAVRTAESATSSVQEVLNATGAELQTAKAELESERKRAAMAEQKLKDEMAKGTKTSLAAQLAEAIQEAEEAKEELRQLKINVSGASTAAPSPALGAAVGGRSAKDELKALLDSIKQARGQKRTIGELLVNAELLTSDEVAQSMEEQRKRPQTHLGTILIERGLVSEEAVALALAHQCASNYVDLADGKVDPAAATLINERLAHQHLCIPMHATEEALTLAMANPLDLVAIEDIERATGRKVEVMVSTGKQIREAIAKYYWEP